MSDQQFMKRALELAAHGEGHTSPNPMVGAVIVSPDSRIIGEGYHRCCGQAHAEVNAIAAVKDRDRHLLKESTLYVTLEPCSHYGKTPPCAKLIIETGIPRVVVAAGDPFKEVSGRGIGMLREAGVEVVEGVLAAESRRLNKKFITAHENKRPFVTLKWAQSSDGYMDAKRCSNGEGAFRFSDSLNTTLVHRLRSLHDGIIVGSHTAILDNPLLDCRYWPGKSPRPIVVDRTGKVDVNRLRMVDPIVISDCPDIPSLLEKLYNDGFTSVLVEGGATLLSGFITSGLWDEARLETAPLPLGDKGCVKAPLLKGKPVSSEIIGRNTVEWYENR